MKVFLLIKKQSWIVCIAKCQNILYFGAQCWSISIPQEPVAVLPNRSSWFWCSCRCKLCVWPCYATKKKWQGSNIQSNHPIIQSSNHPWDFPWNQHKPIIHPWDVPWNQPLILDSPNLGHHRNQIAEKKKWTPCAARRPRGRMGVLPNKELAASRLTVIWGSGGSGSKFDPEI